MNNSKNDLFQDIEKSKSVKILGLSAFVNVQFKEELRESLFDRIESGSLQCSVIAESDNQLFQHSLITDTQNNKRMSFEELKTIRKFFINELTKNETRSKNTKISISSLMVPFFSVQTDDNLWYLPINDFNIENYFILSKKNNLYEAVLNYLNSIENDDSLKKFLADPNAEMLELFDQNKIPRGIFPRDSFYNTDHFQYVVWGLVFNREGKLLIHQRKENAKDNQNLWDKSIGGHIAFENEKSSHEAVVRELIEELYTEEKKQQSGHGFSMLSEDISKVYFLGDWRLEDNGPYYLDHIKLIESKKSPKEENWVFYKIPLSITHNTPRILPNKRGERWLRVVADVFIFITNTEICAEYLHRFKNSQYLLIEPNDLKTWMEREKDDKNNDFKVTPDLKYIMTGKLRNFIDEVSTTIKFSNIRKL